ncbi:MAG: ABC transporter permease [Enterococcus lacertideformus]|uniref:Putative hemin transport system permease protein HrtB n=1 Tax=Enterococcus lacertideformus TaxID=2771493 RepID=A0A931F8N9_9ENTE|nr:ABC transporter permease [Enterococcus lacertideformus]
MFLAIKEMKYAKLRYGLIIGIMFLIAYVVFMLSGLASGLAEEFKKAIDDWGAQEIVLSEDANKVFAASQLTRSALEQVEAKEKAPIGLFSGAIKGVNKENVTVFGTTNHAFLLPKITDGRMFEKDNEIIISQNLAENHYKIGDKIKIGSSDQNLTIVGIFPETYYTVSPVIYTNLETWTKLKYGGQPFSSSNEKPINAIVTKGTTTVHEKGATKSLQKLLIPEFIESIPGYSAQNMTLNAMVYFLFLVVAAVIGIFMYVITLQKTSIFGVMKAQGIRNSFIARSLVAQALIIGMIGVILAVLAATLTSLILPSAMPFAIFWSQWLVYSGVLIVVDVLGGVFSIRTIKKVDPITAIGG